MASKSEIALRFLLDGKKWFKALEAMNWASQYHTGVRKDGVTPEFQHQVDIAHYVYTLSPWLEFPQESIIVAFLHDLREDYGVSDEEVRRRFGDLVADAVNRMTKEFRGVRRDDVALFEEMSKCPIASVVKGADRIHNLQSMVGVFSLRKQVEYLQEVATLFLPMLRRARDLHLGQRPAYENIKLVMKSQVTLIKAIHANSNVPGAPVVPEGEEPAAAALRA